MEGLLYPGMDTNERMSDAEMVRRIQSGDSKSITYFYEANRKEFVRWIVKFASCSSEDALEFYQAAILIVYDNAKRNKLQDLSSTLKTYLFAVGKNVAWQYIRQKEREKKLKAEYFILRHMENDRNADTIFEEVNIEIISKCFSQLGDPCHQLLDLFYYHKKSMEEITAELNYKNTDTAKNQKYKCMERLRKLVETEISKQSLA